jgi:uncharacterized RDD family membrane protein YckC
MIIIAGKNKNLSRRYYANVIDYGVFFIVSIIYVSLFGETDEFGTSRVTGFKTLAIPFIWFIYFPIIESFFGQTVGKRILHLNIIDLNGQLPTVVQTFLRRILDLFEIACLGIPAMLTINQSSKNQRIGDMIAGTTVVRTDAICRHCGIELELTTKEVVREAFTCPTCNQEN